MAPRPKSRTPSARDARYTGQLYQLQSQYRLSDGAYVLVNGPWDTFGVVQKITPQDDGRFLNLIRGVKPRVLEMPVASF